MRQAGRSLSEEGSRQLNLDRVPGGWQVWPFQAAFARFSPGGAGRSLQCVPTMF